MGAEPKSVAAVGVATPVLALSDVVGDHVTCCATGLKVNVTIVEAAAYHVVLAALAEMEQVPAAV